MDKVDYSPSHGETFLYHHTRYYGKPQCGGNWVLYRNSGIAMLVFTYADTEYRRRFAMGLESLSGGTLSKNTSAKGRNEYKTSALAFIQKIKGMGIKCEEVQGKRRARVLLVG